jgi:SAM-dependent methyltransferase
VNITNWDQAYQENFTPWDKGEPSPPLMEWVSRNHVGGRVLVPGCGVGHDVACLVSMGIDAIGLDIAPTAIERAKARYPELAERFLLGDLFELKGKFDAVLEHTCLCALPPEWRNRYRDAVVSLLKPGGLLIGIWFVNPEMDPGETGPPFGISPDELSTLFTPGFDIVESYTPSTAYSGREGRELLRVMKLKASAAP